MFFYTALFVACVFTAFIVIYLYNSVSDISTAIFRAILPSPKTRITAEQKERNVATTVNHPPTPWGWNTNIAPNSARRKPAASPARQTPWGWPGKDHEAREYGHVKQTKSAEQSAYSLSFTGSGQDPDSNAEAAGAGDPCREEKFDLAGKTYKTTKKTASARANFGESGKPWGW